jgi:hypothetical protein
VLFCDFPARSVVKFHTYVVDVASCFYLSWIYRRFPSSRIVFSAFCYVFWPCPLRTFLHFVPIGQLRMFALVCENLVYGLLVAPYVLLKLFAYSSSPWLRAGRRVNTICMSRLLSADGICGRPPSRPRSSCMRLRQRSRATADFFVVKIDRIRRSTAAASRLSSHMLPTTSGCMSSFQFLQPMSRLLLLAFLQSLHLLIHFRSLFLRVLLTSCRHSWLICSISLSF